MLLDRIDKGLGDVSLKKELEIELNKKMSKAMRDVRSEIKTGQCLYCKKTVGSFCNSHNVPRFCLENIGIDGEVAGINSILNLPKMGVSAGKKTQGINEAGTFSLICRACDSSIFQDYENPNNYESGKVPTQRMLAQIAMKNYLKFIYKRKMEIAMMQHALEKVSEYGSEYDLGIDILSKEFAARKATSEIDLESYFQCFERAKKNIEKENKRGYFLFYYKLLDYVTPVAIQTPITVAIDLNGNVINDIFNMDPNYQPSDLHLCVFPLKDTTAVIIFFEEGEKKYSKFRKQFKKLDDESKLGVINYLIFLYTEDYFLAKELSDKIDISLFNEVANQTPNVWGTTPIVETSVLSNSFDLSNWNRIPNVLEKQYKL